MSKSDIKNTSLRSVIIESLKLFYPYKKKQFNVLMIMVFLSSVIDVMSFTSIIPVIYLINDPSPINNNSILYFLYNSLNFSSSNQFILFLLFLLVCFFIFKNAVLFFSTYLQNKFIFSVAFQLLSQQISRFYHSDYLKIKSHNSQEYLRYIAIAPQEFATNILLPIIAIFYEFFVIALIVTGLVIYYPLVLLLVFITIVPVSYQLIKATKKNMAAISDAKGKLELESFKSAYEGISGFSDIRLFSKESYFSDVISNNFSDLYKFKVAENIYQWFPRRIIETLVIIAVCILYAFTSLVLGFSSANLVLILLSFATAAYRLMPSVNEILVFIVKIKTSQYVLDYLDFFQDDTNHLPLEPMEFKDKLEWQQVRFNYRVHKKSVLSDIDLVIHKGDFVVITGESGSGKTTIGKIMTGFIKQDSGKYLIDGKEVKHFSEIKDLLAYVTQDFYLFDRSLLENIAIGESPDEIDLDRVYAAIEAANLSDFVSSLPTGLNYIAGEMGAHMSGGQKQRIAIARALYKRAQLLVLDEITSALDMENEKEILDTIYDISQNEKLTVVLITHRISSLKNKGKVYLLENGKLINREL